MKNEINRKRYAIFSFSYSHLFVLGISIRLSRALASRSFFRWNNVDSRWKIANFPVMHSFRAVISPASSSLVMHFLVTQFRGVNFPAVNSSLRILPARTCFVTGFLVGSSARDPRFLGSFSSGAFFTARISLVARLHLFPIFSRSPPHRAFFYYSLLSFLLLQFAPLVHFLSRLANLLVIH